MQLASTQRIYCSCFLTRPSSKEPTVGHLNWLATKYLLPMQGHLCCCIFFSFYNFYLEKKNICISKHETSLKPNDLSILPVPPMHVMVCGWSQKDNFQQCFHLVNQKAWCALHEKMRTIYYTVSKLYFFKGVVFVFAVLKSNSLKSLNIFRYLFFQF